MLDCESASMLPLQSVREILDYGYPCPCGASHIMLGAGRGASKEALHGRRTLRPRAITLRQTTLEREVPTLPIANDALLAVAPVGSP